MYSPIKVDEGFATGVTLAYWLKMAIVSYLIAYHQFGFRLPSLPFDVSYLMQAL